MLSLETPGGIAAGIIMMSMLGLAIGNYATSIVYRLPKGLKIANDPPYCECPKRKYLEPRDMFPFFSWVINRAKCRFCGIKVQGLYAMVELGCAILFVLGLFRFGIGEELILILGLGTFLITLCALYYAELKLFSRVVILVCGFGALYRTLLDGSIFPFIKGGYLGLMIGVAVWGVACLMARKKIPFPAISIMCAVGGLCLTTPMLLEFLIWTILWGVVIKLIGLKDATLARTAPVLAPSLAILLLLFYAEQVKGMLY